MMIELITSPELVKTAISVFLASLPLTPMIADTANLVTKSQRAGAHRYLKGEDLNDADQRAITKYNKA